jgi:hypothetical protein
VNTLIDLNGRMFGIWRVIKQAKRRDNKTRWLCECTHCGQRRSLRSTVLRRSMYARCDGVHRDRAPMPPSPLKKDVGFAAATEVFNLYRTRASKRGIAFLLTRDEFNELTRGNCHYCGASPSQVSKRRHFNGAFIYNGIDRKDSSLGYSAMNCVSCCGTCNTMKQDLPYAEFLGRIRTIYERTFAMLERLLSVPGDTFKDSGTGVNTVLLTMDKS